MQNSPISEQLVLIDEIIEETRDFRINPLDFDYHSKLYKLFECLKIQCQDSFENVQAHSDSLRVLEKFLVLVKRFPNHPLEGETQSLIELCKVQQEHREFLLTIKDYLKRVSLNTLYNEIIRVRTYRESLTKKSKALDLILEKYGSKLATYLS